MSPTSLRGRVVDDSSASGFLELVRPITGQEHPRDVGLADLDVARLFRISVGARQGNADLLIRRHRLLAAPSADDDSGTRYRPGADPDSVCARSGRPHVEPQPLQPPDLGRTSHLLGDARDDHASPGTGSRIDFVDLEHRESDI
jgi:hypothetical protein